MIGSRSCAIRRADTRPVGARTPKEKLKSVEG
jgi:hypothetical protein